MFILLILCILSKQAVDLYIYNGRKKHGEYLAALNLSPVYLRTMNYSVITHRAIENSICAIFKSEKTNNMEITYSIASLSTSFGSQFAWPWTPSLD